MTDYEKKLVELITKNFHEQEEDQVYFDRRMYLDMNGVLSSQGEMTDILFIQYTINKDKKTDYFQLFISSPDDMCQDFIYIDNLTDEEKAVVYPMLMEQVMAR